MNVGDLVRIKATNELAIVTERRGDGYALFLRSRNPVAWYNKSELELVERGLMHKLYSEDEIKAFSDAWGGNITLF